MYQVMTTEVMDIWSPSPGAPSISSVYKRIKTGCSVHLQDITAARIWTEEELNHYITLEKVLQLAENAIRHRIVRRSMILISNNATVIVYMKKQGGCDSRVICNLAQ